VERKSCVRCEDRFKKVLYTLPTNCRGDPKAVPKCETDDWLIGCGVVEGAQSQPGECKDDYDELWAMWRKQWRQKCSSLPAPPADNPKFVLYTTAGWENALKDELAGKAFDDDAAVEAAIKTAPCSGSLVEVRLFASCPRLPCATAEALPRPSGVPL